MMSFRPIRLLVVAVLAHVLKARHPEWPSAACTFCAQALVADTTKGIGP